MMKLEERRKEMKKKKINHMKYGKIDLIVFLFDFGIAIACSNVRPY